MESAHVQIPISNCLFQKNTIALRNMEPLIDVQRNLRPTCDSYLEWFYEELMIDLPSNP